METFRVLYLNGSWIDIGASFCTRSSDDFFLFWPEEGKEEVAPREYEVAMVPAHLVAAVVLVDHILDKSLIPTPVDLSGKCWPDSPIEPS